MTDGWVIGDCYVANNDQEFLLLCEGIVPDAELDAILEAAGGAGAGLEDLTPATPCSAWTASGAWEVAKQLFGADVLGLPYLSIENYSFEGKPVRLFRAGKTSEFGYLLLAPQAVAPTLFDALQAAVDAARRTALRRGRA